MKLEFHGPTLAPFLFPEKNRERTSPQAGSGSWVTGNRWFVPADVSMPAPESMIGPMITMRLPATVPADVAAVQTLRDALLFEDRIEVQMHVFKGHPWVRFCGQAYLDPSDFDRFQTALARRLTT